MSDTASAAPTSTMAAWAAAEAAVAAAESPPAAGARVKAAGPAAEPAAETEPTGEEGEDAAPAEDVPVARRVEWRQRVREDKRRLAAANARIAAERTAGQAWLDGERAKLAAERAEVEARGKWIDDSKRAVESGDWDGYARALGYADSNAHQRELFEASQDPGRKQTRAMQQRLVAMEAELKEKASAAARASEQAAQREAENAQQRAFAEHTATVATTLRARDGVAWQLASEDPEFVAAVITTQRNSYDRDTHTTISVDDAADAVVESLQRNPLSRLRRRLLAQFIPDEEAGVSDTDDQDDTPEAPHLRSKPTRTGQKSERKVTKSITQQGALGAESGSGKFDPAKWRTAAMRALKNG